MNNIGIIGYGTVGQAVHSILDQDKCNIYIIDNNKDLNYSKSIVDININFDIIIICISCNNKSDYESLWEVINECPSDVPILLKTTINYNNYLNSKKDFWDKNYKEIIIWPEFLNELSSEEDIKLNKIILGCNYDSFNNCIPILNNILNIQDINFTRTSPSIASNFKLVRNAKQSADILFWNAMSDILGDIRPYMNLMKEFPQEEIDGICKDGSSGIGGKCLPKDLELFDTQQQLIQAFIEYNKKIRNNNE